MNAPASSSWLAECLNRLRGTRVGVFGDFCLDAYWLIEPDQGERSVETGLPVNRVRRQQYSLGGAGNIAANLAVLGVGAVHGVGMIGDDVFGHKMLGLLHDHNVNTEGVLHSQSDWQTMTYAKPCIGGEELSRIDFGAFNQLTEPSMDRLMAALDRTAMWCDIVVLNQQVPAGVSTPAMIERINDLIARHSDCRFIVDSRHRADLYRGAILKLNAHEAARACGENIPPDQPVGGDRARDLAVELHQRSGHAVFITRGERGIVVADKSGLHESPVTKVEGATDPVGAGDTAVAALAAVLGADGDTLTAVKLANLAARVTVRKLGVTGTASPAEIRHEAAETQSG